MTPIEALRQQMEIRPDHVAFVAGPNAWTYRDLAERSAHLAQVLHARGIRPGDRIALHMTNVPELIVIYYACFQIGAIAAPLGVRFKAAELGPLLRRLQPSLYVGQAELYPEIEAAIGSDVLALDARFLLATSAEVSQVHSWENLIGSATEKPEPVFDNDAVAVLLTTSGTTGAPKFVAQALRTLSAIASTARLVGIDNGQVVLNTMPLMHAGGLAILLRCIGVGAPMVMMERFDPDVMLELIARHQCTWLMGIPFMLEELLRCQREHPRDTKSLRLFLTIGDICPAGLEQEFAKVFGIGLRSLWGCTEVWGAMTYGSQAGPVSRALPGMAIRLVDDAGAPVPFGEVGELLLRSDHALGGYWTGPGRIDGASPDGWFATGDLMRQGDGDDLWYIGRKKEIIVRGGFNIVPAEVEQVLMAHPAVRDAAVTGIPDALLGQRLIGLVQLLGHPEASVLDTIRAGASANLADYKVPERLQVVSAIPRNALGKIDRKALPAMVSASGS